MKLLSFSEFKKLAKQGNLIALVSDLHSDLDTPVSAFLKLASEEPHAFLLESAEKEERIGRFSFLGIKPAEVLKSTGRENPLLKIKKRLAKYRLANPQGLPGFAGGYVGFFSYEVVRFFEKIRLRNKTGVFKNEAVFFLVKEFLLFDHFRKSISAVVLCDIKQNNDTEVQRAYQNGIDRIATLEKRLTQEIIRERSGRRRQRRLHFSSNLKHPEFERKVERIKNYIRAGDCIQVVFSQRFYLGRLHDDFEVYRSLRTLNPSPYMFYFRSGPLRLIGSSPELLVKKTGRRAEVRPIAGTRPRGETPGEDARLKNNLLRSPKEMAEHLMLVDLGRNDLGRVCEFDSIRINDFARVERYSHVMHLVSDITGTLKRGRGSMDLLKAVFPAGTVTGAPKIRAMEIIDELELEKRGPYAGALGYFSFNEDMDMCITIRTIVVQNHEAYVQAGAGIVFDSKPKKEYEESVNKARALVEAVHGTH